MAGQSGENVKQQVQRQFSQVARNYRESRVHAGGADLDAMLAALAPDTSLRALDAGCGAGHCALAFAGRVGQMVACDFSGSMLAQARLLAAERGVAELQFLLADVEKLPFSSGSFDLIVSRYSAHHWPQPAQALAAFRRLLPVGGTVLLSDIMASEAYAQDSFLQTIELLRDPSHVRDYRISEWQRMFAAAGFYSELLLRHDLRLHFATWTQRMATPRAQASCIKALFASAPAEIQRSFHLPSRIDGDDFSFTIPGAVLRATVRAC